MRVALVLGGGVNVWREATQASLLGAFHGTVACNDAGVEWPHSLDAWVSLHASKFDLWRIQRRARRWPDHKALYGDAEAAETDPIRAADLDAGVILTAPRFPGQEHCGSSGLFALKVALVDLGFDKAVLCGVPMLPKHNHFFDPAPWDAAERLRQGWREAYPAIKSRARSMSGWTMEMLGHPTEKFLRCPPP